MLDPTSYDDRSRFTGTIIVRLVPELARVEGDDLGAVAKSRKIEPLAALLADIGVPGHRLIREFPLDKLFELEDEATKTDLPPLHSLAAYWCLDLSKNRKRIPGILARLRWIEGIEHAYADTQVHAPAVAHGDDPLHIHQSYLRPAPHGVDAMWAWGQEHGDGSRVGVVDLEEGWNLAHEDIAPHNPVLIWGNNIADPVENYHGTYTLGVIAAFDNDRGMVGIAPKVESLRVVSYRFVGDPVAHVAEAILKARAAMTVGHVLVLEVQTKSNEASGFRADYPVEIKAADFDAIRLAVATGIVVVEAAGNAGEDLDAYTVPNPADPPAPPLLRPLNTAGPGFKESGAIMVGAGQFRAIPGDPVQKWDRLSVSNYGSRVDCFAAGMDVATTGPISIFDCDDPLNANKYYTLHYNSTSSATAIVGGAAAVLQSMRVGAAGNPFSPTQIRAYLSDPDVNTRTRSHPTERIGVMPNLAALGAEARLSPDVYVRDRVGDTGAVPSPGAEAASPDIILRTATEGTPGLTFGQGSATMDSADLGSRVQAGQHNYIYVRARNRGATDALDVTAEVYYGEPSPVLPPEAWTRIGTTDSFNVATGGALVVAPELVWDRAAIPPTGHYCLIAVLDCARDPKPPLPGPTDWNGFVEMIRNWNNIAWRNIDVVPAAAGEQTFSFFLNNRPDVPRAFDIVVRRAFADDVDVELELAANEAYILARQGLEPRRDKKTGRVRVLLPRRPSIRLRQVTLPAGAHFAGLFRVSARKGSAKRGTLAISQVWEGFELGRVMWRFVREKGKDEGEPDSG